MNNFNKEIQFKISLFINGERGHELIKFLVKKKIIFENPENFGFKVEYIHVSLPKSWCSLWTGIAGFASDSW